MNKLQACTSGLLGNEQLSRYDIVKVERDVKIVRIIVEDKRVIMTGRLVGEGCPNVGDTVGVAERFTVASGLVVFGVSLNIYKCTHKTGENMGNV